MSTTSMSRATRGALGRRRRGRRARSPSRRTRRDSICASFATARAGSTGSSRWLRLRPRRSRRLRSGRAADVPSLFDADFLAGGDHRLALGPTDDIPYLKNQERLTFARVGITDPVSVDDYVAHGGYRGCERALTMSGGKIVEEVTLGPARPRRRGLSRRYQVADRAQASTRSQKYVVCNADEGDSGTFSDRMIMEGDPLVLIEGMTIAAIASARPRVTSTCAPSIRTRCAR